MHKCCVSLNNRASEIDFKASIPASEAFNNLAESVDTDAMEKPSISLLKLQQSKVRSA